MPLKVIPLLPFPRLHRKLVRNPWLCGCYRLNGFRLTPRKNILAKQGDCHYQGWLDSSDGRAPAHLFEGQRSSPALVKFALFNPTLFHNYPVSFPCGLLYYQKQIQAKSKMHPFCENIYSALPHSEILPECEVLSKHVKNHISINQTRVQDITYCRNVPLHLPCEPTLLEVEKCIRKLCLIIRQRFDINHCWLSSEIMCGYYLLLKGIMHHRFLRQNIHSKPLDQSF